jgi:CelD/BcsL family acetyltransferase involved in cellulose biosynthesis
VVTVDRISDPAQLPALVQVWDEMIDESSPGAVFRSSAWLLPWWCHLSEGKELATYVAREGGRVIGVLPAYSVRSAWGGRQLRLLGEGTVTSDCLGVIARPEISRGRLRPLLRRSWRSSATCSSTASWRTTRWST